MHAARNGHKEVAELLLTRGANIYHTDINGWTALLHVVYKGQKATVELLLTRKGRLHDKQRNGVTAFMLTAAQGHKVAVDCCSLEGPTFRTDSRAERQR